MGDFVNVAIYVKGAKSDSSAHFEADRVSVVITMPDGTIRQEEYLLFGQIDPAASKCSVLSTKIELKLKKKDRGDWGQLERK